MELISLRCNEFGLAWKVPSYESFVGTLLCGPAFHLGLGELSNRCYSVGQGLAGCKIRFARKCSNRVVGGRGALPILWHQDLRCFRRHQGRLLRRFGDAAYRVCVAPTRSGRWECDFTFWPDEEHTLSHAGIEENT